MPEWQLSTTGRETAQREERDVRANAGRHASTFIKYTDALCRMVAAAKQEGFDPELYWTEIESYFDLEKFVRIGAFREVTGWADYRALVSQWAETTEFWYNFRRLTEAGDRIVWEIEEHNTPAGAEQSICNSLTVAQFDLDGKIVRLDVYLQSEAMLAALSNWGA